MADLPLTGSVILSPHPSPPDCSCTARWRRTIQQEKGFEGGGREDGERREREGREREGGNEGLGKDKGERKRGMGKGRRK